MSSTVAGRESPVTANARSETTPPCGPTEEIGEADGIGEGLSTGVGVGVAVDSPALKCAAGEHAASRRTRPRSRSIAPRRANFVRASALPKKLCGISVLPQNSGRMGETVWRADYFPVTRQAGEATTAAHSATPSSAAGGVDPLSA